MGWDRGEANALAVVALARTMRVSVKVQAGRLSMSWPTVTVALDAGDVALSTTKRGDTPTATGQASLVLVSTICTPTWDPLGMTVAAEKDTTVLLPSVTVTAEAEVALKVTATSRAHTRASPFPTLW